MTHFVLVHGAFRGGWSWGRVPELLRARGHLATAPDQPNAGDRHRSDHAVVDLPQLVADLAATVKAAGEPTVLVGHSQGSLIVRAFLGSPEVTSALVDLIGVAHLDGAVPEAGESGADLLGGPMPGVDAGMLIPPPPPDPSLGELAEVVAARVRPQHVAPALTPVGELRVEPATAWAFCSQTPAAFPSGVVRQRMEASGEPFEILDGPHDLPLVRPESVADWLGGLPFLEGA